MRFNPTFRSHEGGIREDDVGEFVPPGCIGEGVVLEDVGVGEAVQVEVHQREPDHVGGDVVALEVLGHLAALLGGEGAVPLGVGVAAEDVLVGGDEESGGAAGGVEEDLFLPWGQDLNDELDDVPRGAELAGISLRSEDGEEILEGVAEALAVIVGELVDDLQEALEGLGITVGEVGVLEDVSEEGWDAGILRHLGDAVGVEGEEFVAADAGLHELGPAVFPIVAAEELPLAAQLLGLGVHVVHELVDEGDGDLLDLGLGIGDLPHEEVAGGVDAALGIGVEHGEGRGGVLKRLKR
jgi:hypothetical protein